MRAVGQLVAAHERGDCEALSTCFQVLPRVGRAVDAPAHAEGDDRAVVGDDRRRRASPCRARRPAVQVLPASRGGEDGAGLAQDQRACPSPSLEDRVQVLVVLDDLARVPASCRRRRSRSTRRRRPTAMPLAGVEEEHVQQRALLGGRGELLRPGLAAVARWRGSPSRGPRPSRSGRRGNRTAVSSGAAGALARFQLAPLVVAVDDVAAVAHGHDAVAQALARRPAAGAASWLRRAGPTRAGSPSRAAAAQRKGRSRALRPRGSSCAQAASARADAAQVRRRVVARRSA